MKLYSRDVTAMRIKLIEGNGPMDFIIGSVYLRYDNPESTPFREFEQLVKHCTNNSTQLIIGCDKCTSYYLEKHWHQ